VQTERQGITRQEWQLRLTLVGHLMGVLAGAHHPESKEILRASGGVEVLAGVLLGTLPLLRPRPSCLTHDKWACEMTISPCYSPSHEG
jgi:hypothetical protein